MIQDDFRATDLTVEQPGYAAGSVGKISSPGAKQ